jgi:hypothetical protein
MNKRDLLSAQNTHLNNTNFRLASKIKKLKSKLIYIESIKSIWSIKDRIHKLEHKILINEQQVRFNLMVMLSAQ